MAMEIPDRSTGSSPVAGRLRILVLDPLDEDVIAQLSRSHEVRVHIKPPADELAALMSEADAVIVRSGVKLTGDLIAPAASLKLIVRAGVGTDNIDLSAARAGGVAVFNIPGASAGGVAELSFGLLLALARHIALADRQVRAGLWKKAALVGSELGGKTIGLIGFGAVGSHLARLVRGFDMRVLASVARPTDQRRAECAAAGVELVDLDTLLAESDAVSVQVPLLADTRGLIGSRELDRMKRSSYLINVSRAGVVDEDALYEALTGGVIAGAGIDVHSVESGESRFGSLDNVVLTPHIGASTAETQKRIGQLVVESVAAFSRGEDVTNRVC